MTGASTFAIWRRNPTVSDGFSLYWPWTMKKMGFLWSAGTWVTKDIRIPVLTLLDAGGELDAPSGSHRKADGLSGDFGADGDAGDMRVTSAAKGSLSAYGRV
jgi:hypothetical protein